MLSAHNQDIVYYGANKLFRSMNQGNDWLAISDDLTSSKKRGDVPFATITTIAESPLDFGRIWVGTDDGNLHLTTDGGKQWRAVSRRLPDNRWVSRVVASHFNKDRAYVSFNGYRNDDHQAYVYMTTNSGKSWKNIGRGLPLEAVNVIKEDPVNEQVLYVGTDRGVYVSLDQGKYWQSLDGGLPNVPVHDLVIHPKEREVVIGTHGRSAWVLDALPIQDLTSDIQQKKLHLFYLKDEQEKRSWNRKPSQWFTRSSKPSMKKVTYWSDGEQKVQLKVLDSEQRVLVHYELDAGKGINVFHWDLKVDQEKALLIEQQQVSDNAELELKRQAYHQKKALSLPFYIEPGDYRLVLESVGSQVEGAFEVKAVAALPAKKKQEKKIRGR